jgi:hypothetical protein
VAFRELSIDVALRASMTDSADCEVRSFQRPNLGKKLGNQENGRMKTTLELPDDLVKEIKLLAVREGKKLKEAVAGLLRQGLEVSGAGSGTVVKPEKAMLKRREALTKKFVAGEWGLDLSSYEAGGDAQRRSAQAWENAWRRWRN